LENDQFLSVLPAFQSKSVDLCFSFQLGTKKDLKEMAQVLDQTQKLEEKWNRIINKFMRDEKQQEFISPAALAPVDRRILHGIAEKLDLASESKGEGKHRVVVIYKRKRPPKALEEMSTTVPLFSFLVGSYIFLNNFLSWFVQDDETIPRRLRFANQLV
jgi:hypothetical protein